MDAFSLSAHNGEMRNTLVIGATFGIFLTFGNAWSIFLEQVAFVILPEKADDTQGNEVLRLLLYASLTSFICLTLLVTLVQCNRAATKASKTLTRKNMRRMVGKMPVVHFVKTPGRRARPQPAAVSYQSTRSHARHEGRIGIR